MFSPESAALIGLDKVKSRWPHLTGNGVRILQVEWDTVNRTDHVNAVRDVIKEIAPDAELTLMSEKEYIKGLCGYTSFGFFGFYSYKPGPTSWDIENHSYTGSDADPVKAAAAMDARITRDGLLVYASAPNSISDIKPLWLRSRGVTLVGVPNSPVGEQAMGAGNEPRHYPDLSIPTQWTSIASPVMAASAALWRQAASETWSAGMIDLTGFPSLNGTPRIDYWIADLLAEPRETEAQPVETWTEKREVVSSTPELWWPYSVIQTRYVNIAYKIWEESNLGNTRNLHTEVVPRFEERNVPLPTD